MAKLNYNLRITSKSFITQGDHLPPYDHFSHGLGEYAPFLVLAKNIWASKLRTPNVYKAATFQEINMTYEELEQEIQILIHQTSGKAFLK